MKLDKHTAAKLFESLYKYIGGVSNSNKLPMVCGNQSDRICTYCLPLPPAVYGYKTGSYLDIAENYPDGEQKQPIVIPKF